VARRKAFEYAKSLETYPNKKLSKFKVGKSSTPFKPLFGTSKDGLIRWCIIDFIEFGTYNQLRVYTEMNQGADEGTLRLLEVELETYQRLGFADDVPTTIVNDEEGNSHTIIDEGNEFADIKKAS
jgi:hypothetical protein